MKHSTWVDYPLQGLNFSFYLNIIFLTGCMNLKPKKTLFQSNDSYKFWYYGLTKSGLIGDQLFSLKSFRLIKGDQIEVSKYFFPSQNDVNPIYKFYLI